MIFIYIYMYARPALVYHAPYIDITVLQGHLRHVPRIESLRKRLRFLEMRLSLLEQFVVFNMCVYGRQIL